MPGFSEETTTVPILSGESASLYPSGMSTSHTFVPPTMCLLRHRTSQIDSQGCSGADGCRVYSEPAHHPTYLNTRPDQHQQRFPTIPRPEIRHYTYRRVRLTASLITTLTAAILLFVPIYALYHTSSTQPNATMGLDCNVHCYICFGPSDNDDGEKIGNLWSLCSLCCCSCCVCQWRLCIRRWLIVSG